jgi:hypothetical protein
MRRNSRAQPALTLLQTTSLASFASGLLLCFNASAQQEAIPSFRPGGVAGYATNGAGFAFSPLVPIAVTALGFCGSDFGSYPNQISLFNASGAQLASVQITTNGFLHNRTYYQSIPPLDLAVGATYYLGAEAVGPPTNHWQGAVIDPSLGGSLGGRFAVNPDISYLTDAAGFMPPGTVSGTSTPNPGVFLAAANFEFTVVPEPSVLSISLPALLAIALARNPKPRFRRFHPPL